MKSSSGDAPTACSCHVPSAPKVRLADKESSAFSICWRKEAPAHLGEVETKNPRMAEAGRPSGAHLPQSLPKQGHPEQAAQGHVQVALEDPQGGDPTASLGSLCQCSGTHPAQQCYLVLRENLLCSSWCLLS